MLGGAPESTIGTTLGTVSTGGGGGGSGTGAVAGSDTQVQYNSAGVAGASSGLTFNYTNGTLATSALSVTNNAGVTGTATLGALTVTNATSMTGGLNMNLCNISNVGTGGYSLNAGQMALSFTVAPTSTTISGSYTYYVCTASCTITPNYSVTNVTYFAVGGGGGGGGINTAAGGGAGGLQTNDPTLSSLAPPGASQYNAGFISLSASQPYTLTIGAGGIGNLNPQGNSGTNSTGTAGGNTIFSGSGISTVNASGGGGGGGNVTGGLTGGCGGGAGFSKAAGSGTQGYGGAGNGGVNGGGGGGGIAGAGGSTSGSTGGAGGIGLTYVGLAVGGGGGGFGSAVPGTNAFGGGTGGVNTSGFMGTNGTGGGGGGAGGGNDANNRGGSGGTGVFILGIPTSQVQLSVPTQFGSMSINSGSNIQITANSNIILNPSTGGNVTVSSGGFNVPAGTTTLSALVVSNSVSLQGLTTLSSLTVTNNAGVTGTATLGALTVTNATSMTGGLNMNLCNISNVGTETFSTTIFPSSTDFLTTNASLSPIAPNIITWIDSAFTASITNSGTTLNRVTSRAAAGTVFNASGASAASVTYGNRTLNGIPVISGITRDSFLRSTTGITQTAGTKGFFAVISQTSFLTQTVTYGTVLTGGLSITTSPTTPNMYMGSTNRRNNIITNAIPSFIANSNVFISAINSAATLSNVVTVNGSGASLSTNLQASDLGAYVSGTAAGTIGEGSDPGSTLTVAELIVYDNAEITTTQRQLIEGYLAWKWGLSSQLPSTHPFVSGAPYGNPQTTSFGSMSINSGSNVQISATSNIVLNPSSGGNVTVSSGGFSVLAGTTTLSALVVSNTTTLSSLTVARLAGTTMTGNLNMNTCNISNIGTGIFSTFVNSEPVTFSVATPLSTVCGAYTYYTCTTSCTITAVGTVTAFYFAVGGGGGGGGGNNNYGGGGGGAGGLQTNIAGISASAAQFNSTASAGITLTSGSTYTLVIGGGGAAGPVNSDFAFNGTSTIFSGTGITTISALGGGGAGCGGNNARTTGAPFGCGGGAGAPNTLPPTSGTQGFNGSVGNGPGLSTQGGGGGGIGSAGTTTAGGSGITFPITAGTYGSGGNPNTTPAVNGPSNTGSGGSGGPLSTAAGSGGSGVFILAVFTGTPALVPFGSITTVSSNIQISATSNIVLAPGAGRNVTVSGNLIFPTVNVFTVSGTSLTLTTASAGSYYNLINSGFSSLSLPSPVPTMAGTFWTLRNATSSYLSVTVANNGILATPLILTPSNNTTIVYTVSGVNGATISGYVLF
jgi:hypothetical protein